MIGVVVVVGVRVPVRTRAQVAGGGRDRSQQQHPAVPVWCTRGIREYPSSGSGQRQQARAAEAMNRTPMSQSYVNSQAGQELQPQQQAISAPSASTSSQASGSQQQAHQHQQMMIGSGGAGEQMSQLMCATELTNLLLEFAFSVFVNKPQDIVEYAANYFNQLKNQRTSQQQQPPADTLIGQHNTKRASSDSQRSNLSQNSFNDGHQTTTTTNSIQPSEDEFDYDVQGPTRLVNFSQDSQTTNKPKTSYNRRKSVFAEQYDPAADQEDDENSRVVHSKTDEQRLRLAKAIKSIFLFRSVDPQDMTNILDAMFEVKVSPGDVVIRQGDDGDNFYVVERGKFQIYVQQDDGTRQIRGEYEDNGFFGELALMYNQPRAATVVALTEGSLWAMDRNTFRRIVLKSAFKKRKEYEALFEKVSVLQCLNVSEPRPPITRSIGICSSIFAHLINN